tara:strand:+ start:1709 stop:2668 length:960 start_codon:yes stop_codon:yes gene_type:complete
MIKKQFISAIISLCCFVTTLLAQPVVEITVTPNSLIVGDMVKFNINIKTDNVFSIANSSDKETFVDSPYIDFISKDITETVGVDISKKSIDITYQLQVFGANAQQIPTQTVSLVNKNTTQQFNYTIPSYPIYVTPTTDPNDMNVKISQTFYVKKDLNWGPIILVNILLSIVILLLWKLIKKYRSKKVATKAQPIKQIPPMQQAIEQLDTLFNTITQIDIKDYYVNYSEIIKTYIESLVGQDCVELTSAELLALTKQRLEEQENKRLKKIIEFSDQVKFAKYEPTTTENTEIYQRAKAFITALEDRYRPTPTSSTTEVAQ